jgi:O-antigen ligase
MRLKIQSLGLFVAAGSTALIPNTWFDKFSFFVFFTGIFLTIIILEYKKLLNPNFRVILILLGFFNLSLMVSGIYTPRTFSRVMVGEWHRNLGLLHYLCLTIMLIFFLIRYNEQVIKNLMTSLAWLGIFLGGVGALQYIQNRNKLNPEALNGITLTLGNSNFAAVALVLTSVATMVLVVGQKMGSHKFYLYCLSLISQILLILATKTLQGIILFVLSVMLILFLRVVYSPKSKFFESPYSVIGLIGFSLLGAIYALTNFGIEKFFSQTSSSLLDRYYHWVAAARMIKENYLVGVGVDSYGDNYRLYRLPEALALRGESNTFANNAHNIYLQLGSTSGLFVLFLYLLLNFYILWRGLHALQKNRGNFSVQIVFVLWIVFQTQSLISIDQLGLAVWGWILSGILVSVSFQNESFDKTLKNDNSKASTMYQKVNFQTKKFTILYLSYILISVLILIPGMQQEYKIFALISKINSTQDQIFLNQELSKLYTVASQAQQPSLRVKAILELFKFQRIDLALELANASTIEFPENVAVWDSVASIYEFKGQFEEAVPARRMTVKLDPLNQNLIDLLDKNLAYLK